MSSHIAKHLDKGSGYLFFIGFTASKLRNIPIGIVAIAFNLISLLTYLIGYIMWHAAALLYPHYPRKRTHWYGFSAFKTQYEIAALIGMVSAITAIICLAAPVLILPTAWLYAVSNIIWLVSELHKKNHPPPYDEHFSSAKQSHYLRYSTLATVSSIVTAVGLTIGLFLPPVAFAVVTAATVISIAVTIVGLYYWGKCVFGSYEPDKIAHSYGLVDKLGGKGNLENNQDAKNDLSDSPLSDPRSVTPQSPGPNSPQTDEPGTLPFSP